MYKISAGSVDAAEKIVIDNSLWGFDEYKPLVTLQISYDDVGFNVLFTTFEQNPTRDKKNHFEQVNEDSCVELFLNFSPKTADRYMNFEVNANGKMNVHFRKDRHIKTNLSLEDVEGFGIVAQICDDYWTAEYKISYEFLKKYYSDFDIDKCDYIIGNAYKCGEKTEFEHYMSLFNVKCESPDFHRPEYFGEFKIIK